MGVTVSYGEPETITCRAGGVSNTIRRIPSAACESSHLGIQTITFSNRLLMSVLIVLLTL